MTYALVWNVESGILDVNSEGRYNTQLTEWMTNFGEAQYSYLFNQTNQYTIIADSDEEDIEFNDATGEWSPTVNEFSPGPQTMYYRHINPGGSNMTILCNNEGKLVAFDVDYGGQDYEVVDLLDPEIQFTQMPTEGADDIIEACGGVVYGQILTNNAESNVTILVYNNSYITVSANGYLSSGEITEWQT